MQPFVVIAAAMVASSVPLLWWAVGGARNPRNASSNLTRGLSHADLRHMVLSRSTAERTLWPAVTALARFARRITPIGLAEDLERRIELAGRPAAWSMERALSAKIVLGGLGLALGLMRFLTRPTALTMLMCIAMALLGYVLPDMLLRIRAKRRQEHIRRALSDTLDQLTICVEAGLGFEGAMARAGRSGTGPLADELIRTLQEMQLGASRSQALRALADRTEIPELRQFVLALTQAEAYGLPLAATLRIQAAELRVKRRQRAEEHAMKIPVQLIFPLVVCILPSLFLVIIGPVAIRLLRFFSGS